MIALWSSGMAWCTMALGDGIFVLCHYYTLYHYYTIYYSTCSIALCDCLYEPKGSDRAMLTKTMKTSFRFLLAPPAAHPVLRYAGLKQNIKRASPCGFSLHFKLCLSFDEWRINGAGSLYKIPCTVHRWHASPNTVPKTSNLARNREVQRLISTPYLLRSTLFLKMYDISLRGDGTSWKSSPGAVDTSMKTDVHCHGSLPAVNLNSTITLMSWATWPAQFLSIFNLTSFLPAPDFRVKLTFGRRGLV